MSRPSNERQSRFKATCKSIRQRSFFYELSELKRCYGYQWSASVVQSFCEALLKRNHAHSAAAPKVTTAARK